MAKSIAANSLYNFALKFFRLILPILVSTYILHTLDPTLYGIFSDAETWVAIALIFGVYAYGIREAARVRDDRQKSRELFTSLFLINLVMNAVVLAAYSGVVLLAVDKVGRSIYLVLGLKIFSNFFMVEWLNEAFENYRFITIKTIVVRLIYMVLIFACIHKPEDILVYCVIIVAMDLLNNLLSFFYINRQIPITFRHLEIRRHILPICSMLIISNVNLLYTRLDRVMLGQVLGTDLVPMYSIPQSITDMISTLIASIVMVAVPRLAYYSEDHPKEYLDLLNRSYRSFMLVVFPACIGMACLSREVIRLYSGSSYDAAIPVLAVFAIRSIESSVYMVCANQILYIKNREKFLVKMLLMGGILNVIFNGVAVLFGIFSPLVAISTTFLAEIVLMIVLMRYIHKEMEIPFYIFTKTNLKYLLLSLTFVPVTIGVHLLGFGELLNAGIVVPVCVAIYFGALLLTKDETMLFLSQKVLSTLLGRFKKK